MYTLGDLQNNRYPVLQGFGLSDPVINYATLLTLRQRHVP